MSNRERYLRKVPISEPERFPFDDLVSSSKDLNTVVAKFDAHATLIKKLKDRVEKTNNTYFSIDEIIRIINTP